MEKGPFVKNHALFALIRSMPENQTNGCMGFTYETFDRYAAIWFKTMEDALAFRDMINAQIGWSIISKPDYISKDSDSNPFTCDAACVSPLPKDIAEQNDKYGGDAMLAALARCVKAGIEV